MDNFIKEIPDNVPKMSKHEVKHYLKHCKQVYLHSEQTDLNRLIILLPCLDTQQVKNGWVDGNGRFQNYVNNSSKSDISIMFITESTDPEWFMFWANHYYPKVFKYFQHMIRSVIEIQNEDILKQLSDDNKIYQLVNHYFELLNEL